MKRMIIMILCLVFAVSFAGCGRSQKADYPAMIMVNGIVYGSLDKPVHIEVDKSIIQYSTSYIKNGVPRKDGETNFNRDLGTPYAVLDDMVVVLINGEWMEFQPIRFEL